MVSRMFILFALAMWGCQQQVSPPPKPADAAVSPEVLRNPRGPATTGPVGIVEELRVMSAQFQRRIRPEPTLREMYVAAAELAQRYGAREVEQLHALVRQRNLLAVFVLYHLGRAEEVLPIVWENFSLPVISYAPPHLIRIGLHQRFQMLYGDRIAVGLPELLCAVGDEGTRNVLRDAAADQVAWAFSRKWELLRALERLERRLAMEPEARRLRAADELQFWRCAAEVSSYAAAAALEKAGIRLPLEFLLEKMVVPADPPPSADWWAREVGTAIAIVAVQKERGAVPRLLEMLAEDGPWSWAALDALGIIASPEAIRGLERLLKPDWRFNGTVTWTLQRIGNVGTLELLRQLQHDRRYSRDDRWKFWLAMLGLEQRLDPRPEEEYHGDSNILPQDFPPQLRLREPEEPAKQQQGT